MRALLLLFIATSLPGCTSDDLRVVSVDAAIENESAAPAAMRLYAVTRETGSQGQDTWLPVRVESVLAPGERLQETDELVLAPADPVLWFWATAVQGEASYEVYEEVPDGCRAVSTWSATARFDGVLDVEVAC